MLAHLPFSPQAFGLWWPEQRWKWWIHTSHLPSAHLKASTQCSLARAHLLRSRPPLPRPQILLARWNSSLPAGGSSHLVSGALQDPWIRKKELLSSPTWGINDRFFILGLGTGSFSRRWRQKRGLLYWRATLGLRRAHDDWEGQYCKLEDPSSIPRAHARKPGMVTHISTREGETGRFHESRMKFKVHSAPLYTHDIKMGMPVPFYL